jgi:hypothetical protein
MQYLMLLYASEAGFASMTPEQQVAGAAEYMQFTQDVKNSGKWVGSNRLRPVASSTTVRVQDGKRVVTDGPFAETKEQLGGYYLIEAKDLDEAIAIAARCPGARHGVIEVRPIWEMGAVQSQASRA